MPPSEVLDQMHSKYRPDIDGLRALAVLLVVIFHAYPEFLSGGFIGVDVFFVISGYLISSIIFQNLKLERFRFSEFYIRRILRIFPALLIVLVSCYLIGWLILLPSDYMQLGKHILGGSSFISNFLLWSESGYFDKAADSKILLHLWSLGIEEQFYIFWPILLWIGWRFGKNLLLIALCVAIISFVINIFLSYMSPIAGFYSPLSRFWEFLIGSVVAYVLLYKQEISNQLHKYDNKLSCAGLLLLFWSAFALTKDSIFPGWLALMPTMAGALLIFSGQNSWSGRKVLSSPLMVWFGLLSFPLYLWHWPILTFSRLYFGESTQIQRLFLVLLAIVLSWLTFILVERPIRNGANRYGKTFVLVFLMLLLAYGGFNIYQRSGYSIQSRLKIVVPSQLVRAMILDRNNFEDKTRRGSCYLDPREKSSFDDCNEKIDPSKKTIYLWGDSYSAHTYIGLNAVYGDQFNIIQRSSGGCPPIPNFERLPNCIKINKANLKEVDQIKPDIVVLSGRWNKVPWEDIEITIQNLQAIGIKTIYWIGTPTQWDLDLPKLVYGEYNKVILKDFLKINSEVKGELDMMPLRFSSGYDKKIFEENLAQQQLADKLGIIYINPLETFCSLGSCMVRENQNAKELFSYDDGHLSPSASKYLFLNSKAIKLQ